MRTELHAALPGATAPTRIVLLPAALQGVADFLAAGFADAIRHRGLAVDLLLVDPQLRDLTDRSVLTRLHADVVLPARAAGCTALWLGGISLGGFMALLYAASYPAELTGLCLLAPYLGNHMITSEIAAYRSMADWQAATAERVDVLSEERRLWRYAVSAEARQLHWHLAYGRDDRFAAAHRLLAAQLPAGSVQEREGGHDWPAWQRQWLGFLDRLPQPPATLAAGAS